MWVGKCVDCEIAIGVANCCKVCLFNHVHKEDDLDVLNLYKQDQTDKF